MASTTNVLSMSRSVKSVAKKAFLKRIGEFVEEIIMVVLIVFIITIEHSDILTLSSVCASFVIVQYWQTIIFYNFINLNNL